MTGVEGDWSWARAGGSFSQVWTANPGNAVVPGSFTNMSSRLDWVSSLRARLGYLVMPNIMAYGTGGIALGRFDYAANNSNAGTYVTTASVSSTQVGYVLGGGLEWAVTRRWLLRGEYRFYSFGNAPSVAATSAAFPTFPSGYSWNKQNVNVTQLGLSYKF